MSDADLWLIKRCELCAHITDNPERESIFAWCAARDFPTAPAQPACKDFEQKEATDEQDTARPDCG